MTGNNPTPQPDLDELRVQAERVPLYGFEGSYEIDRQGNIWSHYSNRYLTIGHIGSYCSVALSKGGKSKNYRRARLVASTFIRPPKPGETVNHINFNKTDDTPENLEWLTLRENIRHYFEETTDILRGEGSVNAKLSNKQVKDIRRRHDAGTVTMLQLAEEFNVHMETIKLIVYRKTWPDPDTEPDPRGLWMTKLPRNARGTLHYAHKLTEAQVLEIRKESEMGHSQMKLGDKYGVSHSTIEKIVKRRIWKHI